MTPLPCNGFLDVQERDLFVMLNSVVGVGPKLALAALSALAPVELVEALRNQDIARLTAVSGVARKRPSACAWNLRDKVGEWTGDYCQLLVYTGRVSLVQPRAYTVTPD